MPISDILAAAVAADAVTKGDESGEAEGEKMAEYEKEAEDEKTTGDELKMVENEKIIEPDAKPAVTLLESYNSHMNAPETMEDAEGKRLELWKTYDLGNETKNKTFNEDELFG